MNIIHVTKENAQAWAQLCCELWPDHTVTEMLAEFDDGAYQYEYLLEINNTYQAFVSLSIRHDYVEGKTESGPVGYLEGIYVRPEYRQKGAAKALVNFARTWSAERGCSMLASDCELWNEESRQFHNKVGFSEESVNVHFTMPL